MPHNTGLASRKGWMANKAGWLMKISKRFAGFIIPPSFASFKAYLTIFFCAETILFTFHLLLLDHHMIKDYPNTHENDCNIFQLRLDNEAQA
jgi:hypothetical protein